MNRDEKIALLTTTLERAADLLGDITPHACALYYQRVPHGRAQFEHHDRLNPGRLEGEMVEQAVYCLMEWLESRATVEIILMTTLPHHIEVLDIGMAEFAALMTAVCDTIAATIPPEREDERALLGQIHDEMQVVIAEAAATARPLPAMKVA